MHQFRHGDVIIQEVEKLPADLEALPHLILAHGEVTGHAHRLNSTQGKLFRSRLGLFVEIKSSQVSVTHEEHADIALPPGFYQVWRQREYTPQEIRIVRD
jgi:hypothetical protein